MRYSDTIKEMKKAGVVATNSYYRGPPHIIKLDVEFTGDPKVKISPVLTKETVLYKGKQQIHFNSIYVCTLKVAGERHGTLASLEARTVHPSTVEAEVATRETHQSNRGWWMRVMTRCRRRRRRRRRRLIRKYTNSC
jgi:hypothetical protein